MYNILLIIYSPIEVSVDSIFLVKPRSSFPLRCLLDIQSSVPWNTHLVVIGMSGSYDSYVSSDLNTRHRVSHDGCTGDTPTTLLGNFNPSASSCLVLFLMLLSFGKQHHGYKSQFRDDPGLPL